MSIPGTAPLATRGLAVGYAARRDGGRAVLADLDLDLRPGRLTCLLGPNGSGKSTLLRTLAGMQPPLAGRVTLGDRDLPAMPPRERARELAVVLTDRIDPGLTTGRELVGLGRHPYSAWDGRLRPADIDAVDWALAATGASSLAGRRVSELSDGERQRLLIARALAQEPSVLLLDEPVAYVDVARRLELTRLLRWLALDGGRGVLLTTHDLDLALRCADDLWVVGGGDPAATVTSGAPEDLVLDGTIGRVFTGPGAQFDPARGQIRPTAGPLGTASVRGEGLSAIWAGRALERVGLVLVEGVEGVEEPSGIEVTADAGGFTLRIGAHRSRHADLGDLVDALQHELAVGRDRAAHS